MHSLWPDADSVALALPSCGGGFGWGVGWVTSDAGASEEELMAKLSEMMARRAAAEKKAWWRGMTALVGETDQQLVVIGPRSDAAPDDLRGLGQALDQWKREFAQARHIWGLGDLLDGQLPRTPPIYLMVPYPVDRFEERFEQVALVYVAAGTNIDAASKDLCERIKAFHGILWWLGPPDAYSFYQR
jgi:hypothetical protein